MLRQIRIFALLSCALVPAVAQAGPIAGPDGVLRYPFGERTPPTLRCKPAKRIKRSRCSNPFLNLTMRPTQPTSNVACG